MYAYLEYHYTALGKKSVNAMKFLNLGQKNDTIKTQRGKE